MRTIVTITIHTDPDVDPGKDPVDVLKAVLDLAGIQYDIDTETEGYERYPQEYRDNVDLETEASWAALHGQKMTGNAIRPMKSLLRGPSLKRVRMIKTIHTFPFLEP